MGKASQLQEERRRLQTMARDERADVTTGYTPSSTDSDLEKRVSSDAGGPKDYDGSANSHGEGEVFGDEADKEVKYRTMKWWHAALVMIAETISLGILSLPSTLAAIGLVPGIVLIIGLGAVSTYTGYVFWQFKLKYPQVHNMGKTDLPS